MEALEGIQTFGKRTVSVDDIDAAFPLCVERSVLKYCTFLGRE